ncbi:MAG: STAS domain-containing protein [Desulfomonilaceae bacterium]
MEIEIREHGGAMIVTVTGRLETLSPPSSEKMLENHVPKATNKVILDLNDLQYVSSAGLRSFLVLAQKARAVGGWVVCCSASGLVKKVLEISKFCEILPAFDTLDDALKQKQV